MASRYHSGIPDGHIHMDTFLEDILKLVLAMAIGGVLGAEREFRDKAAGFRTMILICVGAALFTMFSQRFGGENFDPSRIASNVVTGVGFLGAGAILREKGRVLGLTTAATIWLAAALGMGIGSGEYAISLVGAAAIITVLMTFRWFESLFAARRMEREYRLRVDIDLSRLDDLHDQVRAHGLKLIDQRIERTHDSICCRWRIVGPPAAHESLLQEWLRSDGLQEVGC